MKANFSNISFFRFIITNVTLTTDSADISLKYVHSPTSSGMLSGGLLILPLIMSAMRDWMMGFHDTGFGGRDVPSDAKLLKIGLVGAKQG